MPHINMSIPAGEECSCCKFHEAQINRCRFFDKSLEGKLHSSRSSDGKSYKCRECKESEIPGDGIRIEFIREQIPHGECCNFCKYWNLSEKRCDIFGWDTQRVETMTGAESSQAIVLYMKHMECLNLTNNG